MLRPLVPAVVCLLSLSLSPSLAEAQVVAMPPAVNFPNTAVGTRSMGVQVAFLNKGPAQAAIVGVVVVGANPNDFTLDYGIFQPPFAIGPGVSFTVTVTFAPIAQGLRNADLGAQVVGVAGPIVPLAGMAIGAQQLTVAPNPIDLGGARLNTTTSTRVTVKNAGVGVVKVTCLSLGGPDAGELALKGVPQLPVTFGPGGQNALALTVEFTPRRAGGSHGAVLSVCNDDPMVAPTLAVPITGSGGDPKIAIDVAGVAFGDGRVGLTTGPRTVQVKNEGFSDLTVASVTVDAGPMGAGDPNAFPLNAQQLPPNTTIPPGGQAPVLIAFRPSRRGPTSARLVVTSDDGNTPTTYLPLTGNGTQALPAAAPNGIDFGPRRVGVQSQPEAVTLSNVGGSDTFSVVGIEFSGPDKAWFQTAAMVAFPVAVAPNAMISIPLVAIPLGVGPGSAVAELLTDDPKTPRLPVALRAEGLQGAVSVEPVAGDFGAQATGGERTLPFAVRNTGTDVVALADVRIVGGGAFWLVDPPARDGNGDLPRLLPGQTLSLHVAFKPPGEGEFSGRVEIDSDDPKTPTLTLPLRGTGVRLRLEVDSGMQPPSRLDFDQLGIPFEPGVESPGQPVGLRVPPFGIALSIDRLAVSGSSAFRVDPTARTDLGPGESTTFRVYFTPPEEAPYAIHESRVSVFVRGVPDPVAVLLVRGTATQPANITYTPDPGCSLSPSRRTASAALPPTLLAALSLLGLLARRRRRARSAATGCPRR